MHSSPKAFETERLQRLSSWSRLKKVIALCLKLKAKLRNHAACKSRSAGVNVAHPRPVLTATLQEMQEAEKAVLKRVQDENFSKEIQVLQALSLGGEVTDREKTRARNQTLKKSGALYKLDPFLDKDGLLRVGGRIQRVNVPEYVKHPIILPRKGHVTELLIRHHHHQVNHMGRGITHNELCQRGYWIIGGSSAVSNHISRCATCRRLRGSTVQQNRQIFPEIGSSPALHSRTVR